MDRGLQNLCQPMGEMRLANAGCAEQQDGRERRRAPRQVCERKRAPDRVNDRSEIRHL